MTTASQAARVLEWDSRFFGFPVAAIEDEELPDPLLLATLEGCRRSGVTLVFWGAAAGRRAPEEAMRAFGGAVVDRKRSYAAALPLPSAEREPRGVAVEELAPGPADAGLLALGIAAGAHSRFRVDSRIPAGKFEALYALWMERSCRRELADVVLVARTPESPAAGALTFALEGGVGRIGLVAVADGLRGRGIGRALLSRADLLMEARGARSASVVTQAANVAACTLYERAGYRLDRERNFHHFWLA